jgi:hypothetical protein
MHIQHFRPKVEARKGATGRRLGSSGEFEGSEEGWSSSTASEASELMAIAMGDVEEV